MCVAKLIMTLLIWSDSNILGEADIIWLTPANEEEAIAFIDNSVPEFAVIVARGPMGGGAFIAAWRGTLYVTPAHTSP